MASRRNSRDSIKSIASNSSLFSNEDVGPLAFQSSARGRQRRTSNFLELPGINDNYTLIYSINTDYIVLLVGLQFLQRKTNLKLALLLLLFFSLNFL